MGNTIVYTDKPADGLINTWGDEDLMSPMYYLELNMESRSDQWIRSAHWVFQQALNQPGVHYVRYHAEGPYQYQDSILWDPDKRRLYVRGFSVKCPVYYNHHIYSTCKMCGQKG